MRDERKLVPSASAAGFGLTDRNGTPHPLDVLQVINGRLLIGFVAEIHKCETTLAARLPVEGQGAFAHLAVLTEQMREILPLSVPGEISNEDRQKKKLIKTSYLRTQAAQARGFRGDGSTV